MIIRADGLRVRAFENLAGMAVVNYPAPMCNGQSQAYPGVAWRDGKAREMLMGKAAEGEEILIAEFDMSEIREFRDVESWRLEHRRRASGWRKVRA